MRLISLSSSLIWPTARAWRSYFKNKSHSAYCTWLPFSEHDNVDHPVLICGDKKSRWLMAHTYSHLYRLSTTGLRFFTVYGPWGRPDMSPILFAEAILQGRPIKIFNHGGMMRDFTYVDDIVEALIRVLDKPAAPNQDFDASQPDPASSNAPYRVFNIGNCQPVKLMEFIATTWVRLQKNHLPMQPGDVTATAASTDELDAWVGFKQATSIKQEVARFVDWYRDFYKT